MTGIADRTDKGLKISGATQDLVLDTSNVYFRAWHTGLRYKCRLYDIMKKVFYLIKSFCRRLLIILKHKSSSKCAINAQNFLSNIYCFQWKKQSQIRLCEKLKALFTGWKVLEQLLNVLNFWMWALFSFKETGAAIGRVNDRNE